MGIWLKKIKKLFGAKVAKIVDECSDTDIIPKPPWLERKKKYIRMVNPFESINQTRLGHSQSWRDNKSKKYYY